jgi:hypothetical protein
MIKACGCEPGQQCRECLNIPEEKAPDVSTVDMISADAHYIVKCAHEDAGRIVKHLWIIFVLLPVVLGILFAIVK